ncbi:hypothetical protein RYX36_028533 [Vicia faba]
MKRTYPVKVKLPQEISSSTLYRFPEPIYVLLFSQFFLYLSTSFENPTKPQPTTIPRNINSGQWTINNWKSKKALQLPDYPNQEELCVVLKTLYDLPPIVFAGEARTLEVHLGDADMGNIGQVLVIKVGRMAEQFVKPRSDSFEEKDGVKLPSYRGGNINSDGVDMDGRES